MEYADSMLSSEARRKAAARCHVHLSTSFRWRHRFLKLADYLNTPVTIQLKKLRKFLTEFLLESSRFIDIRTDATTQAIADGIRSAEGLY